MAVNNNLQDKLSLKNLLFCKAIPNYIIPVPTDGCLVYACKDCGDKFMFESSYEYHINRKSVQITYMCRPCNAIKIFNNRCNLLSHIRSHAFKTATINVSDLKIEPLPLSFFKYDNVFQKVNQRQRVRNICFECKKDIHETGIAYKDRENHFNQNSLEVHTCPICLFTMPNECSLNTHLRIHLKQQPFFCPECGIVLSSKNIKYPYYHNCEGFKMMRATARSSCPIGSCGYFQPGDLYDHFKKKHCKKIFRCVSCSVASYNESSILKHVKKEHDTAVKVVVSFQCDLCPASLIPVHVLKKHITDHSTNSFVYPCWTCGKVFTAATALVTHNKKQHSCNNINLIVNDDKIKINNVQNLADKSNLFCRVVKKCDKCSRCFTYKCRYNQIAILPNECPYRCSDSPDVTLTPSNDNIRCCFCKESICCDWNIIKKHFAQHHKEHKCLDVQILLPRVIVTPRRSARKIRKRISTTASNKTIRKKKKHDDTMSQRHKETIRNTENFGELNSQSMFPCKLCAHFSDSKYHFEDHLLCHRDPCMAYQCMECGECFVGKPSFCTHLVMEHSIKDVEDYIHKKKCFNEEALNTHRTTSTENNEPVRENQCAICRDEFGNADDLEKHFRVHGMAFLLKNTSKNGQPNP